MVMRLASHWALGRKVVCHGSDRLCLAASGDLETEAGVREALGKMELTIFAVVVLVNSNWVSRSNAEWQLKLRDERL